MGKRFALVFLCLAALFTVSNGSDGIKQLRVEIESCGPAFKWFLQPNPLKLASGVMANVTVVSTAAHSMFMGTLEAYMNVWPTHIKATYCEDGKTDLDPKGCYTKKGETRTLTGQIPIDESFASLFTKPVLYGNATLRNEYGEVMLCARFNVTVIDT